jgi:ABC-type Fe3+-hydroxamate transport system substrate-binding protein
VATRHPIKPAATWIRGASLLWVLTAAVLSAAAAWLLAQGVARTSELASSGAPPRRVVSLSPAITETLFAIGAWERVVGVSDHCSWPAAAAELPRLGSAITPQYERIARLKPDLVLSQYAASSNQHDLGGIATAHLLPWLELSEIASSIQRIGSLVGAEARAGELAHRLLTRLSRSPAGTAPRVLLVLAYGSADLSEVWFVRDNSLHGAALRAAGGRNAVSESVAGLPRMSLERVLEIDPDLIVLLTGRAESDADRARVLKQWSRLSTLRAVGTGKIGAIGGQAALSSGPRILDFTDQLEREIDRLRAR